MEQALKVRGFEVIEAIFREHKDVEVTLPHRATKKSAGYDFHSLKRVAIMPGRIGIFSTDVKCYMQSDEVLHLYPRSSMGIKKGLMLANTVPTIDADYYSNPDNDGHIVIHLRNLSDTTTVIEAGDRIAQGVFYKYLIADGDEEADLPTRIGGVGSTGR